MVARVSAEELAMVHAIASDRDETISQMIRKFIRESYRLRFGEKAPPRPKLKHTR